MRPDGGWGMPAGGGMRRGTVPFRGAWAGASVVLRVPLPFEGSHGGGPDGDGYSGTSCTSFTYALSYLVACSAQAPTIECDLA
jgi:hypothetical protein